MTTTSNPATIDWTLDDGDLRWKEGEATAYVCPARRSGLRYGVFSHWTAWVWGVESGVEDGIGCLAGGGEEDSQTEAVARAEAIIARISR